MSLTSCDPLVRLGDTAMPCTIKQALSLWREAAVRFTFAPPNGFVVDDSLAGRLRGALGAEFVARLGKDEDAAALFTLMFDDDADWRRAYPRLARPFCCVVSGNRQCVRFEVRLFGFARAWAPLLAEIGQQALARPIAITERARVRAPLGNIGVEILDREGLTPAPDVTSWACIVFNSPVSVMQGKRTQIDGPRLAHSMQRRLLSLMPWQDLALSGDAVEEAFGALSWNAISRSATRGSRRSSRQRRGHLPLEGERLTLIGTGRSAGAGPLLRILERTSIGGRTAFGYGACRTFLV